MLISKLLRADSKTCSIGGKKNTVAYVGFAIMGLCIVSITVAVVWWKGYSRVSKKNNKGMI